MQQEQVYLLARPDEVGFERLVFANLGLYFYFSDTRGRYFRSG